MAILRWWLGVLACLALLSVASGARADDDAPDIVFLKNGGRVRGTVVEESPTAGVRVKLPTGTLKTVPAAEVDRVTYGGGRAAAPAAPPAAPAAPAPAEPPPVAVAPAAPAPAETGSLHIESAEKGTVYVDGGEVGPTPADVKGLEPGTHRVRVVFDGGGKSDVSVLVQAGENKEVHVQLSASRKAGQARQGVRPVVSGEPFFDIGLRGGDFGVSEVGGGVRFFGGMNLGIVPAVDFRAGGVIAFSKQQGSFALPLQLRATFRFNLGSLYSMEVGAHGGGTYFGGFGQFLGSGGPDLSVLSFRFGDRRQYEITEMTSFEVIDVGIAYGIQNSIGFAWVIPR